MFRPGEFRITDKGLKLANLPEGAKVLEVGCGEGETTERLEKEYKYKVTAIDNSLKMIDITKGKKLQARVQYGDGEFLEDFTSFSFDGVILECVLSLIGKPDEAIHEAFCTLKKGGQFIFSDVYFKNLDPARVEAVRIETERKSKRSHAYNGCSDECADDHEVRQVDFRLENILIKEPLIKALEETGFTNIKFEDFSDELEGYVVEQILKGEEDPFKKPLEGKKGIGYFLIVAQKPI